MTDEVVRRPERAQADVPEAPSHHAQIHQEPLDVVHDLGFVAKLERYRRAYGATAAQHERTAFQRGFKPSAKYDLQPMQTQQNKAGGCGT